MTYQVHLSLKSTNAKTGPIPMSTTTRETCAISCPFYGNGCYAENFRLKRHWGAVTNGDRGGSWQVFTAAIAILPEGQLWRHNQAGDLPGNGSIIDAGALYNLVQANVGKRGFTYTHYDPMHDDNGRAIAYANEFGFTVNLSANNLSHADELAALDIGPVVVVLPADTIEKTLTTAQGRTVVVCPATYRDDVSCATCALCQRQRKTIVGFPAHGASKRKASAIAAQ